MTDLVWRRLSSMPPPERERLVVTAEGSFRLWRSVAPVVGRFGGMLSAAVVADLDRLAAAIPAGGGAPGRGDPAPDEGVEQIEIVGTKAVFAAGDDVAGPWGALLDACRRLADERTDQPVAAIALELDPAAARVRLVHRGSSALTAELASARIDVEAWRGTRNLAAVGAGGFGLGRVEVGPGWSAEATVPAIEVEPGDRVTAECRFVVDDGGIFVPVALLTTVVIAG